MKRLLTDIPPEQIINEIIRPNRKINLLPLQPI